MLNKKTMNYDLNNNKLQSGVFNPWVRLLMVR